MVMLLSVLGLAHLVGFGVQVFTEFGVQVFTEVWVYRCTLGLELERQREGESPTPRQT